MFADVLILKDTSGHDQILTYHAPEHLQALPGALAAVPVRGRMQEGLILDLSDKRPELDRILPIREMLSAGPLLSGAALRLARWLAEYYLCSLNKTVQLFLPPPLRQKEKKALVRGNAESGGSLLLDETAQALYAAVCARPAYYTADLAARKFGPGTKNVLAELQKNNLLAEQTVFIPQAGAKKIPVWEATGQAPVWTSVAKTAPRQAAILQTLQEESLTPEAFREKHPGAQAALRSMEKKGWITQSEAILRRNPLQEALPANRADALNTEQVSAAQALAASIRSREKKNWLLFGVTGSGKTEVYLRALEEALTLDRQALYLVPEISLTPQISSVLLDKFGSRVAVLHSALSAGERHDEWQRIKNKEAMIVLGPRSAVFAPFCDLGLIIIDEEHENTYKQNEPDPRYDARRVAEEAAAVYAAVLVRGSATPSLETWQKMRRGKYELLRLSRRVARRPLPSLRIIDMKKELQAGNQGLFSQYLLEALERTFRAGQQAILFINRRGFHTFLICRECGHTVHCPHCSITLTYHRATNSLLCHYCNYRRKAIEKCPSCGSPFLRYTGTGTERVADEIARRFPGVGLTRLDADTTQHKGSHLQLLKEFQEGRSQVLIGTQMIAKGLDFPKVTLAGIINGDNLVNMPDYQSAERAFQLITQVAGRAGRADLPGEVVVQTYSPEHYVYAAVQAQDYEAFISQEMENRRLLEYPPFSRLIRVLVSGREEKKVLDRIENLEKIFKIEIEKDNKTEIALFGPAPAPISCIKGRFRHHLLLKGGELGRLRNIARQARRSMDKTEQEPRVIIDVEPQNLL